MAQRWVVLLAGLFALASSALPTSFSGAVSATAPSLSLWTDRGGGSGWLLAQGEKYDIIKLNDGRVYTGRIVKETERGYLFRSTDGQTFVIAFSLIADVQSTAYPARPAPAPAPAAPPPAYVQPAPTYAPPPAWASPNAARIAEIDRELASLHAADYSIVKPIIVAILGFGVEAVGWVLYGSSDVTVALLGVIGIVTGALMVVLGAIFFVVNIVRKSVTSGRISTLENEREALVRPPGSGAIHPDERRWLARSF